MKRDFVALTLTLTLTLLLLPACIPIKPPPGEKPFRKELTSFIVAGETSRETVFGEFASQETPLYPLRFDNDAVWLYRVDRDTWQWLVCAGAGYTAACDVVGSVRNYFLKIEFDERDVVAAWDASSTLGECAANGVCEEGDATMVFASDEADRRAREAPGRGTCSIYVFTTALHGSSVSASLDETFVGSFTNDGAFLRIDVQPGRHQLKTTHCVGADADCGRYGIDSETRWVDCGDGEQHYLLHNGRHKNRGARLFVLESVDANGLGNRKLILKRVPDEPGHHVGSIASGNAAEAPLPRSLIRQIQLRLKDTGFYGGRIDSKFNEETRTALAAFREARGLTGSGLLDYDTLAALGIADY